MARFANKRGLLAGLIVASLCSSAWAGGLSSYRRIASKLANVAKKSRVERIAVLPFEQHGTEDSVGSVAVSERLIAKLADHRNIKLVERSLLDRIMGEQRLQHSGPINPGQAKEIGRVMGVDAVVTGTLLSKNRSRAEVNARLIHTQSARVLGVAIAEVERDWTPEPGYRDHRHRSIIVAPPQLSLEFTGWWENAGKLGSGEVESCERWETRVSRLQRDSIEAKARYWATRLREPDFSMAHLTRNPGSEIRSMSDRQAFYRRLRALHRAGHRELEPHQLRERLDATDEEVRLVLAKCEH